MISDLIAEEVNEETGEHTLLLRTLVIGGSVQELCLMCASSAGEVVVTQSIGMMFHVMVPGK